MKKAVGVVTDAVLHIIIDPYRWNDKEPRYALYKSGGARAIRRALSLDELLKFAIPYATKRKLSVCVHNRDGTVKITFQFVPSEMKEFRH